MLILHNAIIHTLDPQDAGASALAIEQRSDLSSRILASGDVERLQLEFPKAKLENLEGRVVMPGLIDAHLHLRQHALTLQALDCGTPTRAACLELVAARPAPTAPRIWILGHGWQT